ncbi:MAG: IS200/IS605 family transposase [Candidatus Kapaibacterium sp.]
MPQSYGHAYIHIIFSTKRREPILTPQLHTDFSRYITPILQDFKVQLIAEGGMPDHVHLLIDLGRESSLATVLREIKSKSSAWLKSKIGREFNWQGGHGYFSVSPSHVQNVVHYIDNQEEHHKKKTFQEEFEEILKIAGVDFNPKYLWNDDE